MKRSMMTLALLLTTQAAFAGAPVYLKCNFSENRVFGVTLNEDAAKATVDYGTGKIQTYAAKFSPADVKFVDDTLGAIATSIFTVDRTTLKMARFLPSLKSTDVGQCALIKAPAGRKF